MTTKLKDIKVYEEDWKYLDDLKKNSTLKNFADLIQLILVHTKEAILKEDFEILTKGNKK